MEEFYALNGWELLEKEKSVLERVILSSTALTVWLVLLFIVLVFSIALAMGHLKSGQSSFSIKASIEALDAVSGTQSGF